MEGNNLRRRSFLASIAGAPILYSAAAGDALSSPVLEQVRLGAEFFLNATETRDSVDSHFARMADTGLTIARIFTIWDHVERRRGEWNFERYDWIYDAAARNKIYIANTLCSEDPPGWMGTAPFYHQWQDLSNPELRPYSALYIDKVVNHYKGHPAHGVWLLQNEPGIREGAPTYVLAEFAQWLRRQYGDIEALNRRWYRPLARFEDAVPPVEPRTAGWPDYPSNLDWRRFRCDHLAAQLRWIHAEIDRRHPGALTHINPPGLTSNMPANGRDMWLMKSTAHFMGASMHAAWHFTMFPREDFGVAYGYCCDLIRSVSTPAPWWVTELQAGPTVFTGSRPLNPRPEEITRWLWDGVGNGARGIVFWLWHPRTEGNEAGEWALAGPSGEPTARTRATRDVAAVLRKHGALFAAAAPIPARTAILYDTEAMLLYAVDAWRRPADELMQSLMGCYKALHRQHVPVDFLATSELEKGAARQYEVLYLPYCYALTAKSAAAIREFVRAGGTVWADGLVAWKDEQGVTKQFPPGPLADVFGFTLEDIDAQWEPFSLAGEDKAGELWRCLIHAENARVLLRAPDGRAVAVENTFGAGRAIYYGSAVTLAFLRREDSEAATWIAEPAVAAAHDLPVQPLAVPGGVSFRRLRAGDRFIAVLNNWGEGGRATVRFPGSARSATELITGKALTLRPDSGGMAAEIEVSAGASAVIATGIHA